MRLEISTRWNPDIEEPLEIQFSAFHLCFNNQGSRWPGVRCVTSAQNNDYGDEGKQTAPPDEPQSITPGHEIPRRVSRRGIAGISAMRPANISPYPANCGKLVLPHESIDGFLRAPRFIPGVPCG